MIKIYSEFDNHIKTAADENDTSYRKARNIVHRVIDFVAKDVADGKTVKIPRLGTFSTVEHNSRQIKDINTGEYITIPARRKVKYKPNKWIITQINE